MANTITIELEIDESGAIKDLQKVGNQARKSAKKAGDGFESNFNSRLKRVAGTLTKIGALAASVAAALTLKESIQSAIAQEEAVRSLNSSLALAGSFSRQASADIQQFASDLQKVTTVGDETTLALFGLARNLTRTNEQAKQLTSAAVQLSAATGLSLESSVKNLGKTFGGLTGELGESLPAVKQFTQEQLKAGAAIDFVLQRFGGAAENKVNTFAGAIKQLSNAYGDSLEQQGFLITKSPILIGLIQKLTKFFERSAESTKKFRESFGDIFKPLANGLIFIGEAVNKFLVRPLEFAFNVVKNLFTNAFGGAKEAAGTVKSIFSRIGDFAKSAFLQVSEFAQIGFDFVAEKAGEIGGQVIQSFGKAVEFLKPFVSTVSKFVVGIFDKTSLSFDDVVENIISKIETVLRFLGPVLSKLGIDTENLIAKTRGAIEDLVPAGDTAEERFNNLLGKFDGFRDLAVQKFESLKMSIKEALKGAGDTPLADIFQKRLEEIDNFVQNAKSKTDQFKNNTKDGFEKTKEVVDQTTKNIIGLLNGALVNTVAAVSERIGRQLIEGTKAWKNWEQAIAGIIGDLLINLGKALILKGIAIEKLKVALSSLNGGLAIAAGAALVALGGALKAGAGIGVDEVTSGASAGGVTDAEAAPVAEFEPVEQQTQNQIIVQGDVFDSEETGLRIFDIISEQSEKNGNVIVGGAFA